MTLKKFKGISDAMYILIIIYAIAVVAKNYYDKSKLPEGVCPITNNYTYMVVAIGLLLLTFVVTTIVDYKFKKQSKKSNGPNDLSKTSN